MEVMRIDDSICEPRGKQVINSFKKENACLRAYFGNDFKNKRDDISVYVNTDTSDSNVFNFNGYLKTFKRVVLEHSRRAPLYHKNHRECDDLIFLIFDESNCYVQVAKEDDLLKEGNTDLQLTNAIFHGWYNDKLFIDILKDCKADYVIWVGWNKRITIKNKELKTPLICIYDIKNIKDSFGVVYKHNLMLKI